MQLSWGDGFGKGDLRISRGVGVWVGNPPLSSSLPSSSLLFSRSGLLFLVVSHLFANRENSKNSL